MATTNTQQHPWRLQTSKQQNIGTTVALMWCYGQNFALPQENNKISNIFQTWGIEIWQKLPSLVVRYKSALSTISIKVRETEGAIKTIQRNWQHWVHKMKTNKTKNNNTVCIDTTVRKQTQITLIRHELSYKQLEIKTNLTSPLCGNRYGHHKTGVWTERHIIGQHKKVKRWATSFPVKFYTSIPVSPTMYFR